MRLLIHADDFGLSPGINRGILEAIEADAIDGTSVMIHLSMTEGAALRAAQVRKGLHFAVGSAGGGRGDPLRTGFTLSQREATSRLRDDIQRFADLFGHLPHYLDSHQHLHIIQPFIRAAFQTVSKELALPVRWPYEPRGQRLKTRMLTFLSPTTPNARFLGLDWTRHFEAHRILERLQAYEADGVAAVEWMVHPGYDEGHPPWDGFRIGREQQLRVLIDQRQSWDKWREPVRPPGEGTIRDAGPAFTGPQGSSPHP